MNRLMSALKSGGLFVVIILFTVICLVPGADASAAGSETGGGVSSPTNTGSVASTGSGSLSGTTAALETYEVDGIKFYTQEMKDNPAKGEYPIRIDGYTADLAMIMEYYNIDDVTPKTILAIDDRHEIGSGKRVGDIAAGNLDSILSDRTTIADYYGLEEHEIFRGFDMQQLRRRLKGYKYRDNSPVLIHFGLEKWSDMCSFVLDYRYDEDGLQDIDTYRYIPRYVAYRCETKIDKPIDYDGSHLYITSMVALSYETDEDDNIIEITVYNPYSPLGQGAKITKDGMRLTDGTLVPEINLNTIKGYMFFDKI